MDVENLEQRGPGEEAVLESTAGVSKEGLSAKVIEVLRTVFDPEIPVNIYELGLIYDLKVNDDSSVVIRMTLTSPACPVAGSLPGEVECKIRAVPGVSEAKVELVWDPPWNMQMLSEAAKLQLGL